MIRISITKWTAQSKYDQKPWVKHNLKTTVHSIIAVGRLPIAEFFILRVDDALHSIPGRQFPLQATMDRSAVLEKPFKLKKRDIFVEFDHGLSGLVPLPWSGGLNEDTSLLNWRHCRYRSHLPPQ